ncbi:hypothetical protein Q7P37_007324 [Cladosporium fusiforme]
MSLWRPGRRLVEATAQDIITCNNTSSSLPPQNILTLLLCDVCSAARLPSSPSLSKIGLDHKCSSALKTVPLPTPKSQESRPSVAQVSLSLLASTALHAPILTILPNGALSQGNRDIQARS